MRLYMTRQWRMRPGKMMEPAVEVLKRVVNLTGIPMAQVLIPKAKTGAKQTVHPATQRTARPHTRMPYPSTKA